MHGNLCLRVFGTPKCGLILIWKLLTTLLNAWVNFWMAESILWIKWVVTVIWMYILFFVFLGPFTAPPPIFMHSHYNTSFLTKRIELAESNKGGWIMGSWMLLDCCYFKSMRKEIKQRGYGANQSQNPIKAKLHHNC